MFSIVSPSKNNLSTTVYITPQYIYYITSSGRPDLNLSFKCDLICERGSHTHIQFFTFMGA